MFGRGRVRIRALNPQALPPGEHVIVGIDERGLVQGSFAVYFVPLLAMIGGAGLGQWFASHQGLSADELMATLGGIAGLLAGFVWLRRFSLRVRRDPRFQPVILHRHEVHVSREGTDVLAAGRN